MREAGLPEDVWAHSVRGMARASNQAESSALGRVITPHERLTGAVPDLSDEHELGQAVWVHINKEDRKKNDIIGPHGESEIGRAHV